VGTHFRGEWKQKKIQKVKARDRTYQPATGFLYAGKKSFPANYMQTGKKSISCLFKIIEETEVYT